MKRPERLQRLLNALRDIDATHSVCILPNCGLCEMGDDILDAVAAFEFEEERGLGADLVDAERLS